MHTELNQRTRKRRGAIVAWTAVSLTTLFGFAALAVDGGYLYNVKADLQNAADAAALAATITMFDEDGLNVEAARRTAVRVAAKNMNVSPYTAMHMMDFSIGRYDDPLDHTQRFLPIADDTSNAARVVLHRTKSRGQPVRLFFSAIWGKRQADISAAAVAGRAHVSAVPILPIALRDPSFGTVDPDVTEHNPGKDGPSFPTNGEAFELGEEVTIFVFGKGPRPMIHLTLDMPDWNGVSNTNFLLGDSTDLMRTDSGGAPLVSIGDQFYVENLGTGNQNFGVMLLDRIQDGDNDNNTILVPIIQELPDSRDADGKLAGKVEVVDFVAIHLDRVAQVVIPNDFTTKNTSDTITVETLVGTIVSSVAHGVLSSEAGKYGEGVFTPILLR